MTLAMHHGPSVSMRKPKFKFKFKGCFRCGNKHDIDATCPAMHVKCLYCKNTGHLQKVCIKKRLKQVHEIVQSPEYQGQEIHLHDDDEVTSDSSSTKSCNENSDSEPIPVFLDTITSKNCGHSMSSYPNKISTAVMINDKCTIKMKVDTGPDTCVLATDDLQRLGLSVEIQLCSSALRGYGGNPLQDLGATNLQVTLKNTSIFTKCRITPIDDRLPSPYELLYGRKVTEVTTTDRGRNFALQSKHPDNDAYQKANQQKQTKQAEFYSKRASCDKRVVNNSEPVYVLNSRKHIWEKGKVFNHQNPDREPRTYIVEINGKLYQRTRECLRLKGTNTEPPESRTEGKSIPTFPQVTSQMAFEQ